MDSQPIEQIVGVIGVLFILALVVFIGYLYWRIAAKAGYPGVMGLLMFVPLANIVMIIVFAFSEWPILREVKELRGERDYGQGDYQSQVPPSQQPPQF